MSFSLRERRFILRIPPSSLIRLYICQKVRYLVEIERLPDKSLMSNPSGGLDTIWSEVEPVIKMISALERRLRIVRATSMPFMSGRLISMNIRSEWAA